MGNYGKPGKSWKYIHHCSSITNIPRQRLGDGVRRGRRQGHLCRLDADELSELRSHLGPLVIGDLVYLLPIIWHS